MRLKLLLLFLLGSSRARRRSGLSRSGLVTGTCGVPGVGGRCRRAPVPRARPGAQPGPRRAGERGAGGTKRLLRPRLCSRRGPAPSPCRSPAPPPHRAAPLTTSPALTPLCPRHHTASSSYLSFPSLQLLQPLLILHGVCTGEQGVTGSRRRGSPRALPSAGAHTLAVRSGPVPPHSDDSCRGGATGAAIFSST